MTMGGENKNKELIDQQLATGDFVWLCMAGLVAMLIVWVTLKVPDRAKSEEAKYCYHYCIQETDKNVSGQHASGSKYMSNLKSCYQSCMIKENKAKHEENTDKDTSD